MLDLQLQHSPKLKFLQETCETLNISTQVWPKVPETGQYVTQEIVQRIGMKDLEPSRQCSHYPYEACGSIARNW